jgi:hypothetical protein
MIKYLRFCVFSPPGALAVFLRERYSEYVTPCKVLVVVLITFLSPQQGGWSSCTLMGAIAVGSIGSLCNVEHRLPSTSRVVNCHSVEEDGFQLLDRRYVTLLQGDAA